MINSSRFILVYHGIGESNKFLQVTENNFKNQIEFLLSKGFSFVSIDELLKANGRAVSLVFDDGLSSIIKVTNFLKENNIYFGISLITDRLRDENMNYLKRAQLLELNNCEFYSHTKSHLDLTRLSLDNLRKELLISKSFIKENFKKDINILVYPFGKFNPQVITIAKDCGYEFGLSLLPFHLSPSSNKLVLPRININGFTSLNKFKFFTQKLGNLYLHIAFLKHKFLKQDYLKT